MPISRERVVAVVRRHRGRAVAAAVLAVGLLVVAALGGFQRVRDAHPAVDVALNTPVDVGPALVTVTGVRVLHGKQVNVTSVVGDPFDDVLVVVADVEVTAPRTHVDVTWAVEPVDRSRLLTRMPYPRLLLARSGQTVASLQPHLRERVAWVWPIAKGSPIPTSVDLHFAKQQFRRSSITGVDEWLNPPPREDVPHYLRRVPVADRRQA